MTDKLKLISLSSFLGELSVEPSYRTQLLMEADANRTIEDYFGAEKAREWTRPGELVYVGKLPVGSMRRRSVIADMKEYGYIEIGAESPRSIPIEYNRIRAKYSEDRIVTTTEFTLSGITQLEGKEYKLQYDRVYFLKPEVLVSDLEGRTELLETSEQRLITAEE